jgi:mono/diheme cytochrome c family protein
VEQALQYMRDDDVKAIAVYLKTLPAARGGSAFVPGAKARPTLMDGDHTSDLESVGAAAYRGFCASCHQAGGEGVPGVFPRLKGNPSVLSPEPSSLIRLVIEGGRPPRTAGHPAPPAMPGFAGTLTDVQQAQVLSYIRSSWGNSAEPVSTSDVSKIRSAIKK